MGFAAADFVVAAALKWTPREDPLTLVEAFLAVSETRPDVKLLLVGDGPLRDVVRERLRSRADRVHLPGYVPYSDLPKYYGAADVLVHPAVSEPWGVSVNEAMACGLPVLAAEGVGAAADLVVEGGTGYSFADGDTRRLAELLQRLAADRDLARRLGQAARARVAEWDYEHAMRELERAVASVSGADVRPEERSVAELLQGENTGPAPQRLSLSVVIPTYRREDVLVRTVEALLRIGQGLPELQELILVDQTRVHEPATASRLDEWSGDGRIRWLRESEPNLTRAMNIGLCQARGDVVLFLDDDIVPGTGLFRGHLDAYRRNSALTAVVGQVLQPEEEPVPRAFVPRGGNLRRFLDFPFFSTKGRLVENVMAGNLSVRRLDSIAIGGFDENFVAPVASRFETEFAKRLVAAGRLIWFEPSASIRHLRAPSGGTRALGSHLSSALPCFGVGDYYYALRSGRGMEKWWYVARKPWREVRTKFHLRHPWWIPVKLVGEVRAFVQALRAVRGGPRLLKGCPGMET
jgi:GT2 family glycosyltransferase